MHSQMAHKLAIFQLLNCSKEKENNFEIELITLGMLVFFYYFESKEKLFRHNSIFKYDLTFLNEIKLPILKNSYFQIF